MSFLRRAKSMHERGDAVRASIILAEGLKRDPSDGEALEWLLHLYVEELPNPGIEGELIRILAAQPNGSELYRIVESELTELGHGAKLKALERVGGRDAVDVQVEAPAPEPTPDPVPAVATEPGGHASMDTPEPIPPSSDAPEGESWDGFDNPIEARRRTGRSVAVADEDGNASTGPSDGSERPWDDRPAELAFDDEPWDEPTSSANTNVWWWVGGVVGALALIVVLAMTVFAEDDAPEVDGEFQPDEPAATEPAATETEGSTTGDEP